ncbi:MAG: UvrD-helicase domain-containing protein [Patescibacteria group bacterium]
MEGAEILASPAEGPLRGLNPGQQEAVRTLRGPVLVVAGAGSGKTRALTHRVAHLIASGIPPEKILAVTFTNKAAGAMKERIKKLLTPLTSLGKGEQKSSPTVGTFHAVCVQILRREIHQLGRENRFVIYDEADSRAVMRQIFDELRIDDKEYNPRAVLGAISWAKGHLVPPEGFRPSSTFQAKVAEIYPRYQKKLCKITGWISMIC